MGRLIGSFMDDNELDRPDLNKCPDCECYFPQDNCPICGKECPEDMRAGNRKKQKKKPRNGRSKTVQYVDWYHKWWFIVLMLLFFPIIGIILLASSPHKKSLKITLIVIAFVYAVISSFGITGIAAMFNKTFDKPVDTSLTYEEYVGKCESIDLEEYYRKSDDYKDRFIKAEVTVVKQVVVAEYVFRDVEYTDYYLCKVATANGELEILVRDCVISDRRNLNPGLEITVFGECEGRINVHGMDAEFYSSPCINAAYIEVAE